MTLAVTLTVDELRALVRDAVRAELGERTETTAEIMTREQVAELLNVDVRTITNYVKKRGLPATKLGGNEWRFRRTEVLKWIEQRKGA